MMGHMPAPSGLIVNLADVSVDSLLGPIEVLIQESLSTFTLHAASTAFGEVMGIFGTRGTFGIHGLSDADQVRSAVEAGAGFVFADVLDADVVDAVAASGVPGWFPAMTPTEIRAVLTLPVEGAMLFPAGVVGHEMAGYLKSLDLVSRVVPRGGVGAHSAGEWLKAGAPAACIDETLLGDALRAGDLGQLRDRCGSFKSIQRRYRR